MLSPASSGTLSSGGLPPGPPRSASSVSEVAPSPNQVRRSKRQPMVELSSHGSSSCVDTPSPVSLPLSSVGIAHRGVGDYRQQGAHELPSNPQLSQHHHHQSASVGNSPTHVLRSPRMGRKSLRPYQQQQTAPPLYENQVYTPMETLSLNDSPRYRSEPMIYSGGPEQQVESPLTSDSTEKSQSTQVCIQMIDLLSYA